MQTDVSVEPLDVHNWEACAALTLSPEQVAHVQSNVFVIARAQFEALEVFAIRYKGNIAGMYALYCKHGVMWLSHFMLDSKWQNLKIGSQVLRYLLDTFQNHTNVHEVRVSVMRDNVDGALFFVKSGFQILGVYPDGEQVFQYSWSI